jgi:hypothetical protein
MPSVEARLREIIRLAKHREMSEKKLLFLIRAEAETALEMLLNQENVSDND